MKKLKNAYIIGIVFLLLIKLTFVGVGALATSDENRYLRSYFGLEALMHRGDTKTFFKHIVINVAIPVTQIIQLIPCSFQACLKKFMGLPPENPRSLIIPQIFNWLIFIAIILLLYKILLSLFKDKTYSLGITLVCVLLTNMNIYSRHLFPYDYAMVMTLICLLFYLRSDLIDHPWHSFFLGSLSSVSFATYPGYYITPVLIAGLCFLNRENRQSYRALFKLAALFTSGFLAVTVFFEILGRFGGTSYIVSMITASGKITQGNFSAGYIFIPCYFYEVEGINGVCLLLLYLGGIIYAFREAIKGRLGDPEIIILLSFGGMLFHSVICYHLHLMVWYGRLLHIYLPFISIGAAYFCYKLISQPYWRNITVACFIIAGAIHFSIFAKTYFMDIAYPRDVLYSLAVNPELLNKDHFINQLDLTTNIGRSDDKTVDAYFALPPPQNISHYSTDTDYYLVNCGIIWAIRENEAFATPTNKKLLFSSNHFEAFPPYMYEQFDSLQKSLLTKKELRLEVYKNKP